MADDRQALVLIHGIGEQRPMSTLRGFVDTAWRRNRSLHHPHAGAGIWNKPDSVSGSFELRSFTTAKNRNELRTDFFEFYWAHLMHGTRAGHVLGWARELLLRRPRNVPRSLRAPYLLLWLIALAVLVVFMVSPGIADGLKALGLSGLGLALGAIASGLMLNYIGDAARYLRPVPDNIQRRHEIREAGVQLLEELHRRQGRDGKPLYSRIIVVGHSLGSVIGYDILAHFWARRLAAAELPDSIHTPSLDLLRDQIRRGCPPEQFQQAQAAYGRELRAAGLDWRVTDFITLGSPLAHAEILLAGSSEGFARRTRDRELPTCPPTMEEVSGEMRFTYSPAGRAPYTIPHHAALFAATRWTNLYFPARWIFGGDLVGGPLREVFGEGIRDVAVHTEIRRGLLSHTLYWAWKDEPGDAPPEHVEELWSALKLAGDTVIPDNRSPCPACGERVFRDFPSGWPGHAAKCSALKGSPRQRRAEFKRRYLEEH